MMGTGLIITSPFLMPQMRAIVRGRLEATFTNRPELETHLTELQGRVANLLLACERLLDGKTPQDSIMYRLIEAHGGMDDPIRQLRVEEWLGRSQLALANVFAVRRRLLDPEIQAKRGLEKLVQDWESLYVTIVGSQPRILGLTDKELYILLDPIEVLERNEPDNPHLAQQLLHIHDEMRHRPLKITLKMVDTHQFDAEGILGYLDLVEHELAVVQAQSMQAAEQRQAQEHHNEEVRRKTRLTHTPPEDTPTNGRRLTISERIASIRDQMDEE
jgi:hypothetical protein